MTVFISWNGIYAFLSRRLCVTISYSISTEHLFVTAFEKFCIVKFQKFSASSGFSRPAASSVDLLALGSVFGPNFEESSGSVVASVNIIKYSWVGKYNQKNALPPTVFFDNRGVYSERKRDYCHQLRLYSIQISGLDNIALQYYSGRKLRRQLKVLFLQVQKYAISAR